MKEFAAGVLISLLLSLGGVSPVAILCLGVGVFLLSGYDGGNWPPGGPA